MSHVYRCMKCRTRNTFGKPPHMYARGRWCRHCTHTTFYPDKERQNRPVCRCGGYHFNHRPGSPCCNQHPLGLLNSARRADAPEEVLRELAERLGVAA